MVKSKFDARRNEIKQMVTDYASSVPVYRLSKLECVEFLASLLTADTNSNYTGPQVARLISDSIKVQEKIVYGL